MHDRAAGLSCSRCGRGQRSEVTHLELFALLKGETGFLLFGSPAALVGVAHDDVAAKARVEVKSDCVGVVTDVDGEPEDRETDGLRQFLWIIYNINSGFFPLLPPLVCSVGVENTIHI